MNKILIVVASMFLLSACATQEIIVSPEPSRLQYEQTSHFFFGGLGQNDTVNAADVCRGSENVGKIETEENALSVMFQFFLGVIYTPRSIKVYCTEERQTPAAPPSE